MVWLKLLGMFLVPLLIMFAAERAAALGVYCGRKLAGRGRGGQ